MFDHHLSSGARWLGAGAIATIICAPAAQAQPHRAIDLALPAQSLSQSLREVSVRSGVSVIAPATLVEGRPAPPLRGSFTVRDAVERLLQESGLIVAQVGEALIVRASGPAAERIGPGSAAEENVIVVTGTNIRGGQPTSQVIVIGRQAIDDSGASSVEQLIGKLPQNALGGVNRENFQVPGAGAEPTEHGAGLNLRGLGQRATLVLINGRRVAPSNSGAFVDVSLIPVSALERVEILTDGASAIYGSDAVGGVVNFILRERFEGLETLVQAGSATQGDGDVLQLGATAGTSWPSGRALLSYEFRLEDAIEASDRSFTVNLRPATTLLPRERRHSLFGAFAQELGSNLRLELTGTYGLRDTRRSHFLSGSPIPIGLVADAASMSLSGTLSYDIGSGWLANLAGGYAQTSGDQRQSRPGEQGLVNERSTRNAIADIGLKLNGALLALPGGAVRLALGGEVRRESYLENFRTRTISAEIDQSRTVAAAFAEAQVPLVTALNRRPGLERLIVTAAGRFEHYDRFGSSFDPKIGILWSPLAGLALRSSFDTSFRAPLLSESAGVYSAIYVPAAFVYRNRSDYRGVGLTLGGTNPDVRPERSRSWTFGAELEPPGVPGLAVRINYYAIRFSDRIALPSPTVTVVGDPAFESIITRDPDDELVRRLVAGAQVALDITGPRFTSGNATPADVSVIVDGRFSNTAETRTRGLDFNLAYSFPLGGSQMRLAINANHILEFSDQLRPTSSPIDALDAPYRPLDLRIRGHAGWSRNGWSANLSVNHADGYRDNRGTRDLPIGPFTTVDLGIAFDGAEETGWPRGTRVAFHVENLLDTAPPRLLPDPGSTVGVGYDPVNASARGRFVSLQLRRTW